MNGFTVSDTGYFVYCNGRTDSPSFEGKIEFDVKLIPYTGSTAWIEPTIKELHAVLGGKLPDPRPECAYCRYVGALASVV